LEGFPGAVEIADIDFEAGCARGHPRNGAAAFPISTDASVFAEFDERDPLLSEMLTRLRPGRIRSAAK